VCDDAKIDDSDWASFSALPGMIGSGRVFWRAAEVAVENLLAKTSRAYAALCEALNAGAVPVASMPACGNVLPGLIRTHGRLEIARALCHLHFQLSDINAGCVALTGRVAGTMSPEELFESAMEHFFAEADSAYKDGPKDEFFAFVKEVLPKGSRLTNAEYLHLVAQEGDDYIKWAGEAARFWDVLQRGLRAGDRVKKDQPHVYQFSLLLKRFAVLSGVIRTHNWCGSTDEMLFSQPISPDLFGWKNVEARMRDEGLTSLCVEYDDDMLVNPVREAMPV
jgi:hypothetical protein